MKTTVKPDLEEICREYDALGRLSRYFGKGLDYCYTYDLKNRLLKVEDRLTNFTIERTYDIHDNVLSEKLSNLLIRSEYDPYGRRTSLYLPNGAKIGYTYQGPYLYSVTYNNHAHIYSERNLAGKPTKMGNATLTYDPALRWKSYRTPHFKADYTYDELGNLKEYTYQDPLGKEKCIYTYDDLNQLLSENGHLYTYDSLFNRTAKDNTPYSLNSLSQITHNGQKSFSYDLNGNLISDGESNYQYDILDRLIGVTKGKNRTTFAYDAFNRRIKKNDDTYIWDGRKEIGMMRKGKPLELRVLGEGLGAEIGAAVLFDLNGTLYIPTHDHRGSLVTLEYKKNCKTYRYTAFGEQTTPDTTSPWRFASKRHDPETGFVYFGRRYYFPSLGRWITADPLGFKDGPNLYAYLHNSPLLKLDLFGEKGQPTTPRQEVNDCWHRIEGAGFLLRDLFLDILMNIGSRVLSPREEHNRFKGEWSPLSWKDPYDHPGLIARTLFPYNYDLRHLPESTSRVDRLRAEGAAGLEMALFAFTAARGASGLAERNASRTALDLTNREYTFSGFSSTIGGTIVSEESSLNRGAESLNAAIKLNRKLAAQEIAGGHAFTKHAEEFGFKTREQMASHIENIMTNPTMTRPLSNERMAFWDNASGAVVIKNPKASDGGTMFVPKNGIEYFINELY